MLEFQDPHSCYRSGSPRIKHISFDLFVDFDQNVIRSEANYSFDRPLSDVLELDIRDLHIISIEDSERKRQLPWEISSAFSFGQVLKIRETQRVNSLLISFITSPESAALQWLTPEQTAGKQSPYVYSQCQAILARTIFPCQDSPSVRFTYEAILRVPKGMTGIMAALPDGKKVDDHVEVFYFRMPHPIPSYLFAFAAGKIESRDIGPRSKVFAEPQILDAAAEEFMDVESMIREAEGLFGTYVWDRFNLLVMPPSFPYGGMENPTLTFLTPTLIAGDRSLVSVVAHELAHSWTGNLVTNATWEDFWLNEGWTVYAERRIMEKLLGEEMVGLLAKIGRNDLLTSVRNFGNKTEFTRLKPNLQGMNPDDAFSSVPYEKGFLFLIALEREVGRSKFDPFVRAYISDFSFQSITTEQFLDYVNEKLPGATLKINTDQWIHQPGLPESVPTFPSTYYENVREIHQKWKEGQRDLSSEVRNWKVQQKVLFLEELPKPQSKIDCAILVKLFDIENTQNTEILLPYLCLAASSGYEPVYPRIRVFLSTIGRNKYLKPLYRALNGNESTKYLARDLFEQNKPKYHSVARLAVEKILGMKPVDPKE